MSVAPIEPAADTPLSAPGRFHRLSVDQYLQMGRSGVLNEDDRVELLEGWLVEKMTKNSPHIVATYRALRVLIQAVPACWLLLTQDPVTTDSDPEPDFSIMRGVIDDFLARKPGRADAALVVEVSDSSLAYDRGIKKRIYARAGIPVYWIINIPAKRLEVYSQPTGPAPSPDYGVKTIHGPDDEVALVLDVREVARLDVRDLLP